ncbi:sigma-54 dependent transcriptional regulator [Oceanicella sp. SM1341]|uniref:nitrogen assimilation response regulator NtrX n=1 Tax=Oceanicella sp. SM1341 TaxID=1548889 RepID=UPI000E46AEE4|nr:sigma-54 dependent transcriptional regulator [Oceanicella sp. SM1341]
MTDILVVDDEPDIRTLLTEILADEGHQTRMAWDADTALAAINERAPDLVVLDIWLQDSRMDGIEILKTARRDNPDLPVVIISGHGNVELAVAAVKQGAYDFIEKPFNIDQLMVVVDRALEASKLRRANAALRRREQAEAEMIGESGAMRALRTKLDRVAKTNSRVLLAGPPGSGKEVAARYIHRKSERAGAPFIVVNAATIAPERMEEVLFGREYADRSAHDPGLFEQAHRGILFIDEVADMPLGTQSKILRVLVDQSFARVGGSDTVRVDVRVISATNRNLTNEIAEGRFREELFHRLNVVPIDIPALDSRREDIPPLCRYYVEKLHREQGLPLRDFTAEADAALQTLPWPGNVRQLRNLIERLLILGPEKGPIQVSELPREAAARPGENGSDSLMLDLVSLPLREAREVFEREYLVAQINRFSGNISRTASFVGMERSALHRKLKSLNVVTLSRGGARIAALDEEEED